MDNPGNGGTDYQLSQSFRSDTEKRSDSAFTPVAKPTTPNLGIPVSPMSASQLGSSMRQLPVDWVRDEDNTSSMTLTLPLSGPSLSISRGLDQRRQVPITPLTEDNLEHRLIPNAANGGFISLQRINPDTDSSSDDDSSRSSHTVFDRDGGDATPPQLPCPDNSPQQPRPQRLSSPQIPNGSSIQDIAFLCIS